MSDVLDIELLTKDQKVRIRVSPPGTIVSILSDVDHSIEISGLGDVDIEMIMRAVYTSQLTTLTELIRLGRVAAAIQQRSGLDGIMLIREILKLDATDFVVVRNEALKILHPGAFDPA